MVKDAQVKIPAHIGVSQSLFKCDKAARKGLNSVYLTSSASL